MSDVPPIEPPHDCRLTIRCLKENFGFRHEPPSRFDGLRAENSCIDTFFERRQNDAGGGEGGDVIKKVQSRPAFSLHCGRMRGATWFDRTRAPQGIVWLLGVEEHDERHKGRGDAYDIFGRLDEQGALFPQRVDYLLYELDRRLLDSETFAEDVARDADRLLAQAMRSGQARGQLARVPTRMASAVSGKVCTLSVAVSTRPVRGARSGQEFPLDQRRYLLLVEAVRQAAARVAGSDALADDDHEFPGGLRNERGFIVVFEAPT